MMKHAQRLLAMLLLGAAWPCLATNYYIDSVSGDDGNSGTSQVAAWETLANINSTTFQPGDSILFKAGQSWTGTIKPQGSGTSGNPIVIGMYGSGSRPALNGDGSTNCTVEPGQTKYCTIFLYNQEYWVIRDLEITNYDSSEESSITLSEWESDNVSDYANVTNPAKYTGTNTKKCGVLVQANDVGKLSQLHFINLEVHGVNGQISQKNNGGIFFRIFNFGSETPTYFDDILIEDCYIHDVDRTGISNESDYDNRTLSTNTDWTPSTNLVIRNTTFERTGANALIVRVADGALIENCHFDYCSIKESGNAAFNFNTDNTIWQYNEFEHTKANDGDHDAGGVDSDYRTKGTIIQYNYLHDNDFGMLVTGGPGAFNDGTIVRYNIFERDGLIKRHGDDKWFVLRSSGAATNTTFHNNVIYLSSSQDSTKIVFHKGWSGSYPDNTSYYNNIFYNLGSNSTYEFTSSTGNLFAYNAFYGNTASNVPTDNNGLTSDPLLSNPGGGDSGYELGAGSPALGSGIRIASIPDEDYYQNEIAALAPVDRGVHQVSAASTGGDTLYVIEDAHIRGGSYSSTNYGSDQLLTVKESSNASFTRRTLLKFDLTSYSSISSAKLLVYGSAQQTMTVSTYKVYPDTWSESTITWDNASSFNAFIDSEVVTTSDQWIEFDVTSAAQDEMTGNGTFSIGLMDDATLVKNVSLYSKENSSSQYKARLVVEGQLVTKDVYLIIGQSNTAGRAEIEAQDTVSLNDVYLLNDENSWIQAKNPLNAYSTIRKDLVHQKLGYAYTFGEMMNRTTGKDIGLVVNARGGSNINEWLKGANAGYFDSAYVRITAALALPNTQLKGILWHQGESNKNDTLTYLSKLQSLITDLRDTLGMPNLPFIAGQISEIRPENANFNKLIKTLPDSVANTGVVESSGLIAFDSTHFDSEGQRILGRRYASKVLEMLYGYQHVQDTIWVAEDAHVQDGSFADTNFGTEDLLRVKEATTSGYTRRTYLKFNLQGINGYIVDASLKINGYVNDNESFEVGFYGATDDWAEGSLTWNNSPSMGNKFYTLPVDGSSYKSYTVFATSYVNQEFESDSIVSIGLKDNAVTTSQFKVTSKENQTYLDVRPYILVDYVTEGSSGSRTGVVFNDVEADFDSPMELHVYPNPITNGVLNLQLGKALVGIKVVDMKGSIVYHLEDIHSNQLSVDLSFLNSGIYIIHVQDIDKHVYATRIMKH